jgi:signal recognition particle receptor subunit beta
VATIDRQAKVVTAKVVYYGAALSGKTTNLQHLQKTMPQQAPEDMVSIAGQTDRTLYLDYLPITTPAGLPGFSSKFQLYTVPGQAFYNATRKMVLRGVDGIVFVVDSQWDRMKENVASLENLEQNLSAYQQDLAQLPLVFQYNKRDLPDVADLDYLRHTFGARYPNALQTESVAKTGKGVWETLNAIAKLVLAETKKQL